MGLRQSTSPIMFIRNFGEIENYKNSVDSFEVTKSIIYFISLRIRVKDRKDIEVKVVAVLQAEAKSIDSAWRRRKPRDRERSLLAKSSFSIAR